MHLNLANKENVALHTHGNYNSYHIEYPILFSTDSLRPELKVEMVFIQKAYPDIELTACSLIYDYLKSINRNDIIKQYRLEPFKIKVQTLERTFVDKVFAICDYYLRNETRRNSRHIYDIYKLLPNINLNDSSLKDLIINVREDRKANKTCLSAKDGININNLLEEIIKTNKFKLDYNDSTKILLIKPLDYNEAITSLQKVIDSQIFD